MIGGHVGQNHDGKFQSFGPVHGHQPHSFGAFFDYRRLSRLGFLRLCFQFLHESAKRNSAREFEAAGQIGDAMNIGEHLMSGGPQRKSGVCARGFEQCIHGVRDGPSIAAAVQIRQQAKASAIG